MEEFKTVFSAVALVLAIVSFLVSMRNWRQSNRPVVVAFVKTHKGGNKGIAYDLVVANTGTRPATRIRLSCDPSKLRSAFKHPDQVPFQDDIERCFHPDRAIPLVVHGESVSNSFGMTSDDPKYATWIFESSFPVTIKYSDLSGKQFKSQLELTIRDSDSFAGGNWA